MTLTLSPQEFEKFAADQEDWYRRRYEHVLTNMIDSMGGYGDPRAMGPRADFTARIRRLQDEFAKSNPKPDWRSLIK